MIRIGFDVGGTNIKAGIVDDKANILTKTIVPFSKVGGYQKTVDVLEELAVMMLGEVRSNFSAVESIGIAVPGSINAEGSMIINAHNLDFHDVPMKAAMEKRFRGIPVRLANDANAATLAELHRGALKGCKTAILMVIGTGVGGGIILDGKMFNGGLGHGGEIGHMTLIYNGPLCTCGNRGCIETVCTATWLENQGRQAAMAEPVNAKAVIDRAKEGDPAATKIFNEFVDYLSAAITSIAVLLDPEVIALGGGVSLAGDFLFEPLRAKVEKLSFFKFPHKIVPALLGNDAGMIGAAMLNAPESFPVNNF